MRSVLVVLIGVAWIGCGPFLAWLMGKRGYDTLSWLAVGSLIGPAALAIALMERLSWTQPPPEIVVRGKHAGGSVNLLVLMDDGVDVVSVARPLIEWFGDCVGRLTIALVLPEGGPLEKHGRAARALREAVGRIEAYGAEGMLLFGLTESAVAATVRAGRFHVIVTARPDAAVRRAIAGTDVVHVDRTLSPPREPQFAESLEGPLGFQHTRAR